MRTPYRVPSLPETVDLDLRGSEGPIADPALRRYPDARPLERRLARRWGIAPEQVLVTAGADDALDRVMRVWLGPDLTAVLPVPTFEMTERYASQTGARIVSVPWRGAFPVDALLACPPDAVVLLTSPNNPTGQSVPPDALDRLARHFRWVLLDLAYVEYARRDPTAWALAQDNVVVVRTFSKAHGLAGLRVGYAAGPIGILDAMRSIGAPYPVASPSLALAEIALDAGVPAEHLARNATTRDRVTVALDGFDCPPSEANFVFAGGPRASWLGDGLAGLGIGVRTFPGAVRIGCPDAPRDVERLLHAIRAVSSPQAILLDVDGVVVDVTRSYRRAIVETCAAWGVAVGPDDIARIKAAGNANDDWALTRSLLCAGGVDLPQDEVTAAFEARYQAGLWRDEPLLFPRAALHALAARLPVALVTGRPRRDLVRMLAQHDLADLVQTVVCREDGPLKPDPWPVAEALRRLGVSRAWMLGDTVDDVRAARAAGVVPIGVVSSGSVAAGAGGLPGAARTLNRPADLLELL